MEVATWDAPFVLWPDDRIVLCSDGLHDIVTDPEICSIAGSTEPSLASSRLLNLALEVVSSLEQADAIMRCDVEKEEGGHKVTNATARVFGAKGHESATVRVYDRSGRHLLWEEEVTDKRGVMGIHGGENKLASRIVGKLKKATEVSQISGCSRSARTLPPLSDILRTRPSSAQPDPSDNSAA